MEENSPATEEKRVVIVHGPRSGFAQKIQMGPHELTADEPTNLGGTDTGPNPYDLLLSALGACTSMTLRMYANRKEWPLEGVKVELSHEKIHARDCADCETEQGRIDRVIRTIELSGPLDGKQRGKLLEIANKCPVHRTLQSEINIISRLTDIK